MDAFRGVTGHGKDGDYRSLAVPEGDGIRVKPAACAPQSGDLVFQRFRLPLRRFSDEGLEGGPELGCDDVLERLVADPVEGVGLDHEKTCGVYFPDRAVGPQEHDADRQRIDDVSEMVCAAH